MKKTVTGWIPKPEAVTFGLTKRGDSNIDLFDSLYRTKGAPSEYEYGGWPPVRVKITIEIPDEVE